MRRVYFEVRKVLRFSRAEWDDLPEHDQRMYLDELTQDYQRQSDQKGGGQSDAGEGVTVGPVGIQTRRVVQE